MHQGDYASSSSYYAAGNNAQYPPVPPPNPPAPTQFSLNPPYPSDLIPPLQQHQHQQPIPSPASLSYTSAPPYSIPHSDYGTAPSPYPPQFSDHIPTAPSYAPPPVQQQPRPTSYPSFESHPPYQQQYDAVPSYNPTSIPASSFNQNPGVHNSASVQYPSQFANLGLNYESPFDQRSYLDENLAKYGGGGYNSQFDAPNTSLNNSSFTRSRSDLSSGGGDYYMDDGVYQYSSSNNKVEPYGARGTSSKSSMWSSGGGGSGGGGAMFDDYGRAISSNGGSSSFSKGGGSGGPKIVKAVPKVEVDQDAKSGVQKFRVKLLAESGSQSTMDVLCQIGLDGIRILDPSTSRTLRIYPLETITRCDGADSSIFTFWSKSSVDIEPRRIRLQSNKYTTDTILDIVTAATVQIKEMGPRSRPADFSKAAEQPTEKKKGFGDWMNRIKPANEEKDHWVPDEAVSKCTACGSDFGAFIRRHHCRNCGDIFCDKCTHGRIALTAEENAQPVRVCDRCMAEVTQRLSNAKETASKPAGLQTHEDLARRLQEEMERNRRATSGSKSDSSGRRMKEVACPTCTVHLQVQVPSSGSETIECGVCQHPFLVSAH